MNNNFGIPSSCRINNPCVPLGNIPAPQLVTPPGRPGGGITRIDLEPKDLVNLEGNTRTIITTGKLALQKTGVTAGTYVTPQNLKVDVKGRISSLQDAGGSGPVIRVGATTDSQVAVWNGNNANQIRAVPTTIDASGNIVTPGVVTAANFESTNDNVFVGDGAGDTNTTGDRNVFIGEDAGLANTSGTDNVYVGYNAGLVSTTANDNVFVGSKAGDANTLGIQNVFVGSSAGGANTTGTNNTFFGISSWSREYDR